VAITGLGVIAAIGESASEFRQGLFNGRCGIGPVSLFDTTGYPCQLAAQVKNNQPETRIDIRKFKQVSRCDQLGLIAAQEAI
jgi:3-oxoacyl-[acyl-carrier-protein] synthase II